MFNNETPATENFYRRIRRMSGQHGDVNIAGSTRQSKAHLIPKETSAPVLETKQGCNGLPKTWGISACQQADKPEQQGRGAEELSTGKKTP